MFQSTSSLFCFLFFLWFVLYVLVGDMVLSCFVMDYIMCGLVQFKDVGGETTICSNDVACICGCSRLMLQGDTSIFPCFLVEPCLEPNMVIY